MKGKSKLKRFLIITVSVIVAVAVIAVASVGILFRKEIKIISSLKKVDGTPAYYMEIDDYYFDEFLQSGGAKTDKEVSAFLTKKISHGFYSVEVKNDGLACSTVSAMTKEGNHVWGRTFDWTKSVPIIVRCTPKEGYASIATCDFQNITDDAATLPEGIANQMLAVAALYVPMDGINEKGLCVADLEVNEGGMPNIDTSKPDLTITTAIRIVLNKTATVAEAVELLRGYDIHPSGKISHHLSISDADGNSASIEFSEEGITVVDTCAVTNFNLAVGDVEAGGESAKLRYETLCSLSESNNGILTKEQLKGGMISVTKNEEKWKTQWTIIYDGGTKSVDYYFGGDYSAPITFSAI